MQQDTCRVLFVCLGNICRSTMAEAVMRHLVGLAGRSADIEVDSAGTAAYHVGEPPHPGTLKKLAEQGISGEEIRGRKITPRDLDDFDYIVAMDEDNLKGILRHATEHNRDKAALLSDFVADAGWVSVPDPWYTGDFDETFRLVEQGCKALLRRITG